MTAMEQKPAAQKPPFQPAALLRTSELQPVYMTTQKEKESIEKQLDQYATTLEQTFKAITDLYAFQLKEHAFMAKCAKLVPRYTILLTLQLQAQKNEVYTNLQECYNKLEECNKNIPEVLLASINATTSNNSLIEMFAGYILKLKILMMFTADIKASSAKEFEDTITRRLTPSVMELEKIIRIYMAQLHRTAECYDLSTMRKIVTINDMAEFNDYIPRNATPAPSTPKISCARASSSLTKINVIQAEEITTAS